MFGFQEEKEKKMKEGSNTIILHPLKQIYGIEFEVMCKAIQ